MEGARKEYDVAELGGGRRDKERLNLIFFSYRARRGGDFGTEAIMVLRPGLPSRPVQGARVCHLRMFFLPTKGLAVDGQILSRAEVDEAGDIVT